MKKMNKRQRLQSKKESSAKWRNANREKYREYFRQRRKTEIGKYYKYKYSCKARNLKFELTFDEFKAIRRMPCHYCGYKDSLVGIDRKDSLVGYILNNCLPCCWPCNIFKGRQKYNELIIRCHKIAKNCKINFKEQR